MSTRGTRGGRGRGGGGGGGGDRGAPRGGGQGGGQGGGGAPRGRGGGFPAGGRDSPATSEASRGSGFRGAPRGGPASGGGGGGGGGPPRGGGGGFRGGGGGFRGGPPASSAPLIFAANRPAQIDDRLSSADQLVNAFSKLAVKIELPLRPGYGKLGKPITLRANFFPVKVPKGPLYDYSVSITPKTDINRLKARIFYLLERSPLCLPHVGYIAHDRSERLVSAKELPQPLNIEVPFYDEGETGPRAGAKVYTISITYTRNLNTNELTNYLDGQTEFREYDPLPLISALNLVLQHNPANNGVRVGRNRYFFRPVGMEKHELGLGVEAWTGFFASVRPTYKQLMVNVNVCMTAFYTPGNLADAIMAFNHNSKGGMPKRFSQGIKVTTSHLGYKSKKPLKRIMTKSARDQKFDCEEYGGTISVEDFFKRKYNIKLKYPTQIPVVDISGKNSKRSNYLPAELCEIEPGVPYLGKLDAGETANMIRFACQRPGVNADAIVNRGLPILGMDPSTISAPVTGFDISISNEMAVIPARELPAPRLTYKVGRANIRDGSWNILDVKFHRGGTVATWWVMVVRDGPSSMINDPKDPRLPNLINGFKRKCQNSGMQVLADPRIVPVMLVAPNTDPNRSNSLDVIRQAIKKNIAADGGRKPSFILVLLSSVDNYIYPGIKRLGDVELGVHTIHMQLPKALNEKKQDQYFSNVALKLNTKLGGVNHMLDPDSMKWLTNKKTMIVGMDVTHPGPASVPGTPSIAAVVASVDDTFVQFPASMRVQQGKVEMIQELKEMMIERLLMYQKVSKRLPERVYVYRDGVSEGQFEVVLREELPQILESFQKVSAKTPYRPKLTIIICGKRHHARFYPTDSAAADKNGNTRPGTVVDKGVTEVFGFDFYLQAHAGLQGTVRPTHYTVVYDESQLGADELQQGTHCASYLYARATKAVSLVPAAYYADLACERGRCYINDFLNLADEKTESASVATAARPGGPVRRGNLDKDEEKERVYRSAVAVWGEGLHDSLKDSMFYI